MKTIRIIAAVFIACFFFNNIAMSGDIRSSQPTVEKKVANIDPRDEQSKVKIRKYVIITVASLILSGLTLLVVAGIIVYGQKTSDPEKEQI